MPKLLQNLKIREVSSVARGAGKGVRVMLMKMADGAATLNETLDKSIEKMFEVSAEHGVPPENVTKARKALSASIAEVEKNVAAEDQPTAIEKSLSQCADYLAGLVPVEKSESFLAAVSAFTPAKESAMKPEEIAKMIADAVKAAVDPLQKSLNDSAAVIAKQGETIALHAMSKEHQEYATQIEGDDVRKAFFGAADEAAREAVIKQFPPKKAKKVPGKDVGDTDGDGEVEKAIAKALETSPVLKAIKDENAELKKQLAQTTDAAAVAAFAKKATDLGLPAAHGEVMRKAYSGDADAQKRHEEMLKGIAEQARTGIIFKEFGGGGDGNGAKALDQAVLKAQELQKADPKLSRHQAMAKVWADPVNKELYAQHKAEENAARRAAA